MSTMDAVYPRLAKRAANQLEKLAGLDDIAHAASQSIAQAQEQFDAYDKAKLVRLLGPALAWGGGGGILGAALAPYNHSGEGFLRGAFRGLGTGVGLGAGTAVAGALGANTPNQYMAGAGLGGVGGYTMAGHLLGAPSWEREKEEKPITKGASGAEGPSILSSVLGHLNANDASRYALYGGLGMGGIGALSGLLRQPKGGRSRLSQMLSSGLLGGLAGAAGGFAGGMALPGTHNPAFGTLTGLTQPQAAMQKAKTLKENLRTYERESTGLPPVASHIYQEVTDHSLPTATAVGTTGGAIAGAAAPAALSNLSNKVQGSPIRYGLFGGAPHGHAHFGLGAGGHIEAIPLGSKALNDAAEAFVASPAGVAANKPGMYNFPITAGKEAPADVGIAKRVLGSGLGGFGAYSAMTALGRHLDPVWRAEMADRYSKLQKTQQELGTSGGR